MRASRHSTVSAKVQLAADSFRCTSPNSNSRLYFQCHVFRFRFSIFLECTKRGSLHIDWFQTRCAITFENRALCVNFRQMCLTRLIPSRVANWFSRSSSSLRKDPAISNALASFSCDWSDAPSSFSAVSFKACAQVFHHLSSESSTATVHIV